MHLGFIDYLDTTRGLSMNSANEILIAVIDNFSQANYINIIMADIILYTIADVIIVYSVLKIAAILFDKVTKAIRVCYFLLAFTVMMMPLFFVLEFNAYKFTILSAGISGLHYLIIIYTIFSMRKNVHNVFQRL